jgi:hypothetical protein
LVRGERVDVGVDPPASLIRVERGNGVLQHVVSSFGPKAAEKTTAGLCRVGKRRIHNRECENKEIIDDSA